MLHEHQQRSSSEIFLFLYMNISDLTQTFSNRFSLHLVNSDFVVVQFLMTASKIGMKVEFLLLVNGKSRPCNEISIHYNLRDISPWFSCARYSEGPGTRGGGDKSFMKRATIPLFVHIQQLRIRNLLPHTTILPDRRPVRPHGS